MPAWFTSMIRIGASIGLAALALVALDAAAQPRGAACPARVEGKPLSAADVFDGPIAERASLKPEIRRDGRTSWVGTWGRQIYLPRGPARLLAVRIRREKRGRADEPGEAMPLFYRARQGQVAVLRLAMGVPTPAP